MTGLLESERKTHGGGFISILTEIQYQKPTIACFPSFLELPVLHGFSWGEGSPNMAYKWHRGDPSAVTERVERFLHSLGMSGLPETLVIEAYSNSELLDVTPSYLATAQATERGIFTGAECVFTTLPEVPTKFIYGIF